MLMQQHLNRKPAESAESLSHLQLSHSNYGSDESSVQRMSAYSAIANGPAPIQRQAAPHGGLPTNLKSGIEGLSGIAMDDVRVHYNSSKPSQLQAHAYAQGTDIHIAPGQERHLPHEAWHVVQQKQGRVKPTLQLKGVAINDDSALEREADVMGERAMGQIRGGEQQRSHPPSKSFEPQPSGPIVLQGRWILGPTNYTWHEPVNGLIWHLIRNPSIGEDQLWFSIDGDPSQWDAYYQEAQEQKKTLSEWLADGTHWQATTDQSFEAPEPDLKGVAIPGPKGKAAKEVNTIKGRTLFDFHLTKLLDGDNKIDKSAITTVGNKVLSDKTRGGKDDGNLICDKYAEEFQKELKVQGIPFLPVSFRVQSPTGGFTESSMFLNDPSHPYHGFVIGADIHYATMVSVGNRILVFDNHHPNGLPLLDFLQSIKFEVKEEDSKTKEKTTLDTATLLSKGYVMAFVMTPQQSATFSQKPKDWPGMTIQELATIASQLLG